MVNDELRAYVQSQLERGVRADAVKAAILKIGWSPEDAEEAMQSAVPPASPAVPTVPSVPVSSEGGGSAAGAASPASNLPSTLITPTELTVAKTPTAPKTPPVAAASASLDSISPVVPSSSPKISGMPSRIVSDMSKGKSPADTLQIPTEPAESVPEVVPINAAPEAVAAKPAAHKFSPILIVLLVAIIGAAIVFGYWYVTREEVPVAPPPAAVESVASTPEIVVPVVPAEDPDIAAAKEIFEMIRQVNARKDAVLERQYLSKQTLATLASSTKWQPVWYKDLEFLSAAKEGEAVILHVVSIKENGATSTAETVFVKEETGWKLGIAETIQRGASLLESQQRDARRVADLQRVRIGLELYWQKNTSYPVNLDLVSSVTARLPKDPVTSSSYFYQPLPSECFGNSTSICANYRLSANLESQKGSFVTSGGPCQPGTTGYCYSVDNSPGTGAITTSTKSAASSTGR